jgi:hypothetical protein
MNRSLFRLLTFGLSIIGAAVFASSIFAQGNGHGNGNGGGGGDPPAPPFNYRIELVDFPVYPGICQSAPDDIAMVDVGSGESLFVVGHSAIDPGEGWRSRAWIFDHQDVLGYDHSDVTGSIKLIDVPTLLGLDEQTWIDFRCLAISNNGIVVGYVFDGIGPTQGFWFDLLAAEPTAHFLADDFPEIVDGSSNSARDVNVNGDILTKNEWILNIYDGTSQRLPAQFLYVNGGATAISDTGYVIGYGENGALRFNIHSQTLEEIVEVAGGVDINNLGEFCGSVNIYYGKRNRFYNTHAFRWGYGSNFDWLSDPNLLGSYSNAESINDSGDVVGQWDYFLYSELDQSGNEVGTTYNIKELVSDPYFDNAGIGFSMLTERDTSLSTPAPIIVGNAEMSYTDEKIFILIPEELP